jgi:hypothetical protein
VDDSCPEHGNENERASVRQAALDKLVRLGYLKDYSYYKSLTDCSLRGDPMGATLTISGVSSGSSENVSLELEVGHQLLENK